MTDQRARAEQHVEKRMNALLLYQELLTDSPPDAVTRIVAALADERRRVLDEAANVVKRKTHEPWKSDAIKREGLSLVQAIRAKAHAGHEG